MLTQAISSDPAFVRVEKGVYALACLAPDAEPTARAPRAVKVTLINSGLQAAHLKAELLAIDHPFYARAEARTGALMQRLSGASGDYVQPDGYGSAAMLPDRGQELAAFQQRANEAVQAHSLRLEQVWQDRVHTESWHPHKRSFVHTCVEVWPCNASYWHFVSMRRVGCWAGIRITVRT